MKEDFLDWVSEYATWWQVIQICWWNRFNEKKYLELKYWHSEGIHFPFAMKYIKERKSTKHSNN